MPQDPKRKPFTYDPGEESGKPLFDPGEDDGPLPMTYDPGDEPKRKRELTYDPSDW